MLAILSEITGWTFLLSRVRIVVPFRLRRLGRAPYHSRPRKITVTGRRKMTTGRDTRANLLNATLLSLRFQAILCCSTQRLGTIELFKCRRVGISWKCFEKNIDHFEFEERNIWKNRAFPDFSGERIL